MNYYTINETRGKLCVSGNVFLQIAEDTLNELNEKQLKGQIVLAADRNKHNVTVTIDPKNKVSVNVSLKAVRDSDVQKNVALIQQAIYDAIFEVTEFSSVKVNVSVTGFADPVTK